MIKILLSNNNIVSGSLYLLGNLFNKGIVFITIPIFTRLLTTYEYGVINTYLSCAAIIGTFVTLGVGNSIRSAYIDYESDLDSYTSSILALGTLSYIMNLIIIFIIYKIFINNLNIMLAILCITQAFMVSIIDTILIKYMMEGKYIKRTILLMVPNILVIILSILLILQMSNNKYMGRIMAYIIVYLIFGILYLIINFIRLKPCFLFKHWRYALNISIPLIFHGLSMILLAQSDRSMITIMRDVSETGIYSLVYNFSMIGMVVTSSLEGVWIPWFNNRLKEKEYDLINNKVKIYINAVMIIMILLLMVAPEILIVMAPKEYWSGKVLIPIIILASFFVFLYSISVNLEYYYKSTKIIAINTIISATINIGLNFIFIPRYGGIGAAFTTVVAYIVSFIIHYNAARKLDKNLFPYTIYVLPILIMFSSVILSYLIMDYVILRWILAIVGIYIYSNRFKGMLQNREAI